MADDRFDGCYQTERVYEGGNDDDPTDRGGRTSRGITQSEWATWCKLHKLPTSDVWSAPDDQIEAIYRTQYWDAVDGDEMPAGLDLVLFDGAVNSGPGQSIRWLQRSLAEVKLYDGDVDGELGFKTKRGALAAPDVDAIIADMGERRTAFLDAIIARDPSQQKYHDGWLARVANVTKRGEAAATGSIGPEPVALPQSPKASAKKIPDPAVPVEVAIGAAGAAGAAAAANTALQGATDGLQGAAQAQGGIGILLAVVLLVAVGLALYAVWRGRQKAAAVDGTRKSPLDRSADASFLPPPAPAAVAVAGAGTSGPAETARPSTGSVGAPVEDPDRAAAAAPV